jgi:hypothetical protein
MRNNRRFSIGISLALALASTVVLAGGAMAGGRPMSIDLTGAAEAPGPGDPDGAGTASFTFNPGQGEVCYEFSVTGVDPLTAAHIHIAPAGSPGPVVIPTPITSATGGSGCVSADRDLIVAILMDPSAYYFNVHNAPFPGGALRGQLTR